LVVKSERPALTRGSLPDFLATDEPFVAAQPIIRRQGVRVGAAARSAALAGCEKMRVLN
jgi:hypothetical protein